MALDLNALKARCLQAQMTGFAIGKADAFMADLCVELGRKPSGQATNEALLSLIGEVEAKRAGKPQQKPEPPPEPEDEGESEDEDEAEPEAKSRPKAAKPSSKKKPSGKKR